VWREAYGGQRTAAPSYISDGWAAGLTEHLIDPAWAALYLTTTSASGRVSAFIGGGDDDLDPLHPNDVVDPDGVILDRFQALGLVSMYGGAPDAVMLLVLHRLASIRRDPTVEQPAAWLSPSDPQKHGGNPGGRE
jgi:hypothetical protein